MNLYPYTIGNVSPNALRSSFNPDSVYISKTPQRGNSGNHPIITSGWCGTTNDSDVQALGEIDTDEDGWQEELKSALPDDAELDLDALTAWMDADQDEDAEDADFELAVSTQQGSQAFTWDEGENENTYYPQTRDGWTMLANYDQNDDIDCLRTHEERRAIEELTGRDDGPHAVAEILDAAGIDYDLQDHETYNSGTCGTDWIVIAVADDDCDEAIRAIKLASAIASAGLDIS